MTEFTEWRSLVDGERIAAIPDTVASRPNDDDSTSPFGEDGLVLDLKTNWPSIGARISNNSSGDFIARLYKKDGGSDDDINDWTQVMSIDISDKSSGDAFAFNDVNLQDGDTVAIVLDEGDVHGFANDSDQYPYSSDDIDITARVLGGDIQIDNAIAIDDVGNPDGVLN